MVVAGAGSGKSLTIIGKIIYLIKEKNFKPSEILCISFTNEATNSLKNKLKEKYNLDIEVYTFHKLALNILKSNKITYNIAPDNFLDDLIDLFFIYDLPANKILTKYLSKILSNNPNYKELNNLKRLIKTFISLYKSNNYNLNYFLRILKKINRNLNISEKKREKYLILLIFNIYLAYENALQEENYLDFNDMINKAINCLKNNPHLKKWQYIIIDEYQDTSFTKFKMIEKIRDITSSKLLVVGDDFQSIYRFTGCDLKIFLNFKKYFNYSKIFPIINTYRNSEELITIAGNFIMKNKNQIKKKLKSSKHLKNPIKIVYTNNKIKTLKYILEILKDKEIFVIGRNNNDLNYYIDTSYHKDNDIYTYNNITFKYLTAHRSKGLESDNVILINLEDSILGFPSKIKDEKILKYVNNTKDYYPYEEERRLFYVALTRTKNYTYIITSYKNKSIFITELEKNPYVEQIKK